MKKRFLSVILSMATAVSAVSAMSANAVWNWGYIDEEAIKEEFKDSVQLDIEEYEYLNYDDCDYIYMTTGEYRMYIYELRKLKDAIFVKVDTSVNISELEEQIKAIDESIEMKIGLTESTNIRPLTFYSETITADTAKKICEIAGEKALSINCKFGSCYYEEVIYDYITGYDTVSYINVVEREEGGKIYREYDTVNNRKVLEKYAENHSDEVEFKAYGGAGKDFRGFEIWQSNAYYLIPKKELTTMEHIELAEDIYEETGLRPFAYELQSANSTGSVDGITLDLTDYLNGDANRDKTTTIADAAAIMQAIANPDKYALSDLGEFNADFACDGLTVDDAVAIQKKLAGIAE